MVIDYRMNAKLYIIYLNNIYVHIFTLKYMVQRIVGQNKRFHAGLQPCFILPGPYLQQRTLVPSGISCQKPQSTGVWTMTLCGGLILAGGQMPIQLLSHSPFLT